MGPQTLARRVDMVEQRLDLLDELPPRMDRLESQILQLRDEMKSEFSAVRQEMRAGDEETRREMRVLHEEVIARIALLDEGLLGPRRRRRSEAPRGRKR